MGVGEPAGGNRPMGEPAPNAGYCQGYRKGCRGLIVDI